MRSTPISPAQGLPYKIGVYGSGFVCRACLRRLVRLYWLTNSTGFQGYQQFYTSRRWSLAQHLPKYYGKLQADPNETAPDFGAFRVGAAVGAAAGGLQPAFGARALAPAPEPTPWMDWMRAHRGGIQQTGAESRRRSPSRSSSITRITRRCWDIRLRPCSDGLCVSS